MGEDILQSMLYSFNGFPALPIFIGDFLLTQLQKYFFIPVMIMAVFLGYHYITKHNGGGFAQIAYRAVTSVGIIFAILQANIPMTQYISEVLKTQPMKTKDTGDGVTSLEMDINDMSVFQDVNHYLIVGYMSSFISFSNVIANNLTRKIIYGKTEVMDIGHDGQNAKLMGYFPSLIYNIQKSKMEKNREKVQAMYKMAGMEEFLKKMNESNSAIKQELSNLKKLLCTHRLVLGGVDNQFGGGRNVGFSSTGIFIPTLNGTFGTDAVCDKILQGNNEITQLTNASHKYIPLQKMLLGILIGEGKSGGNSNQNDYIIKTSEFFKNTEATKGEIYQKILEAAVTPSENILKTDAEEKKVMPDAVKALKEHASSYYAGGDKDVAVLVLKSLAKIYELQQAKLKGMIDRSNFANSKFFADAIKASNANESDPLAYFNQAYHGLVKSEEGVIKDAVNKYSEKNGRAAKNTENIYGSTASAQYAEIMAQMKQVILSYILLVKYNEAITELQSSYSNDHGKYLKTNVPKIIQNTKSLSDESLKKLIATADLMDAVSYFDFIRPEAITQFMTEDRYLTVERINQSKIREISREIEEGRIEAKSKDSNKIDIPIVGDIANSIERQWKVRLHLVAGSISAYINAMAVTSSLIDATNPFREAVMDYQKELEKVAMKYQRESLQELGSSNGLEKIRTVQGMFSVYNTMRPEGMMPVPGFIRPISWMDLGIFYSVFKTAYEGTVRNAFIISQVGKQNMAVIDRMHTISEYSSREKVNELSQKFGMGAAALSGIVSGMSSWSKIAKEEVKEKQKSTLKKLLSSGTDGIATVVKILLMLIFIMFLVNIILPTGVWFIALLGYYIEIAVYLSIAPIALILMIFQSYHGAVQKYINVLIMLLLYPSALVAMYFLVLFLDMMMPMLIFSFIPFFNDTNALGTALNISLGENTLLSTITEFIITTGPNGADVGSIASIVIVSILTILMSTYLIFMILRVNGILAQCLQGGGFSMVDANSGVGADSERKLKGLAAVGGAKGMIM